MIEHNFLTVTKLSCSCPSSSKWMHRWRFISTLDTEACIFSNNLHVSSMLTTEACIFSSNWVKKFITGLEFLTTRVREDWQSFYQKLLNGQTCTSKQNIKSFKNHHLLFKTRKWMNARSNLKTPMTITYSTLTSLLKICSLSTGSSISMTFY